MKTSIIGWALIVGVLVYNLAQHGAQWQFGRYFMPKSLLAADGKTYLDGSPVDDITLRIVKSGCEEEMYLGMAAVIGLLLICLVVKMARLHRSSRRMEERLRRQALGLPPCPQDLEYLVRTYGTPGSPRKR